MTSFRVDRPPTQRLLIIRCKPDWQDEEDVPQAMRHSCSLSHSTFLCISLQVYHPVLPWQRRGSGTDEQLLHRAWHADQLQHLLLRLLGLRRQHRQAVWEEPLRGHRCRLAGSTHAVWPQIISFTLAGVLGSGLALLWHGYLRIDKGHS